MEDFSLAFFMRYFDKVVVTDVDIETTRESLAALNLSKKLQKKVFLKEVEYTGFELNDFFDDFGKKILSFRSFDEIDQFIKIKISEIKKYSFLEYDFGKYDFIYVSPMYTQLIYNQLLIECSVLRDSGYPENMLKYIENIMLEEMISVVDRFNENVKNLLNKNGTLFVLSDVFEVNIGSDFDLRIMSGIKNRDIMERIYASYREKFGMGLGDYGLYNLDEKMKVDSFKWLIWPFKEDSNFIVKLKIYKKEIDKEE